MKSLFFCRDEYLLIMMLEKLQSFFLSRVFCLSKRIRRPDKVKFWCGGFRGKKKITTQIDEKNPKTPQLCWNDGFIFLQDTQ